MWPMGTAPWETTSSTWVPGANSPAARGSILNLPPVMALTRSAKILAPPKMVSKDTGQLVAICQLISGNPSSWAATWELS